jgi:membrane-associated protease RseP (regulator of RpoE activity)
VKKLINKTGATAKALDLKKIATKWMLISLLSMGTLLAATKLLAAENLYEKNYQAQNTGNLASLQASPDTKMYVSNHKQDDNISMLESGYDMMGSSGFEAGDTAPQLALQHAKAIKADTVLVYSKIATTKSAASKIQLIKEAAKKGGGEVDAKALEAEPTNYIYYASYWAKLPAPLLGVHVIKLVPKQSDDVPVAEIKGLTILAVIKDSPAQKAGLVRGDVLTKIADVELNKPEELSALVAKNQGKNVLIEYERDALKVATKAQINSR